MKKNVTSWEMEKAINGQTIEMPYSKRQGVWVAEITGTHPVYKLARKFVDAAEDDGAVKTWKIEEGKIYCVCPSTKTKEQYFIKMTNDEIKEYSKNEITEMVK